jgi:group I intron endonuclease
MIIAWYFVYCNMKSGIYIIRNTINARVYIGSAVNLVIRERKHKAALLRKDHHNKPLQCFANKYGIGCLRFDLLETCEKTKLLEREQYWLDAFRSYEKKNGFNINPTAGSKLGAKFSDEAKAKMSIAGKNRVRTKEEADKSRIARTGLKRTEEHIKNYKEAANKRTAFTWGQIHSAESRRKSGLANKGKKRSEETKKRMSEAQKRQRKANAPIKQSAETIQKRVETRMRNKIAKQSLSLASSP